MDANHFDTFTLLLADVLTRRGMLGALAAGAGGLAGLSGAGVEMGREVEAGRKSKRRRRRKKRKKKKCNKKPDKGWCGGKCRNITNDEEHCGACDNACEPGETCLESTCVPACFPNCFGAECGDSDGCGGTCDGTCPPGAGPVCNVEEAVCECPNNGLCCFDTDCAPNERCIILGETNICQCKPELTCGAGSNKVCCNVGQTCEGNVCV